MPNMKAAVMRPVRPLASYPLQQKVSSHANAVRKLKFFTNKAGMCMKTKENMTNCPEIKQTLWLIEPQLNDFLDLRNDVGVRRRTIWRPGDRTVVNSAGKSLRISL